MTDDEFDYWCKQQQLTASSFNLIAAIRAAPPSRRVQGRAKNVSGVYPSRKMGQTIQFESHTVELWAIYQMEHSPDVLEFYDRATPLQDPVPKQKRTKNRSLPYPRLLRAAKKWCNLGRMENRN